MIKVNLLRDGTVTAVKGGGAGGATLSGLTGLGGAAASSGSARGLLIKAILIVVPIGGGYVYVGQEKDRLLENYKKIQGEVQKKESRAKELGTEMKAIEEFKSEKARLQVQVDTIKKLSQERLKNVKALEAIQNIIPEKVWLTNVKMTDSKIEMGGNAVDDSGVSDFMAALEASKFFTSVRLVGTTEEQKKDGTVKKFAIDGLVEGF